MKQKLPMIYQGENTECGLAALAMVLNYYGYQIALPDLRYTHHISLSGMSLAALLSIARSYHLAGRVVRLELNQIDKLKLPAILHWNMNHYVVLKNVKKNKYIIHDPGSGVSAFSMREFSDAFSGIAIELYPDSHFHKIPLKKQKSLFTFLQTVPGFHRLMIKVIIYTFLYQLLLLIAPRYYRIVIDKVVPSSNIQLLMTMAAAYIGLRIMIAVARFLKGACHLKLDADINLFIGVNALRAMMNARLSYFNQRLIGDILYRFNSIEQIRQIITNGLIDGGWSLMLAIFTLIMMCYLSASLTLVSIFSAILFVVVKLMIASKQQIVTAEMLTVKSHEQSTLIENIRGIQPIKIFAREAERSSLWANRYVSFLNVSCRANQLKNFVENFRECLSGVELIIVILSGAIQMIHHQLTLGALYIYLFYRQQFSEALNTSTDKWHDMRLLSVHRDRLNDILLHASPPSCYQTSNIIPKDFSLRAENLSFRHDPLSPLIFENLNFYIRAGERVVFVGPSGSGKSTLIKILMGLFSPSSGSLYLGDYLLDQLPSQHRFMASVMQDDSLLSGSIAQNITFFSSTPDVVKMEHVARLAGVADEIRQFPLQYDTLVGDMGTTLSGGQKQRVLLARALYAEPKILFLDEATSHLDVDKEHEVNQAIKSLGITCVMVAHRQETINMADRVISLKRITPSPARGRGQG